MIEFTVKIAECNILVKANYENTKEYCAKFCTCESANFSIQIENEDIENERIRFEKKEKRGKCYANEVLEIVSLQRKISEVLIQRNTLLIHGSAIAVDGKGYIFTAKSGTGKSTHTRLWREVFGDRAVMINDDKPFLKVEKTRTCIYGSPWMGKHKLGRNESAELKAICVLERGTENKIAPISAEKVLPILFMQTKQPENKALLANYMDLIDKIIKSTSFYELTCNTMPEAAVIAYEGMT